MSNVFTMHTGEPACRSDTNTHTHTHTKNTLKHNRIKVNIHSIYRERVLSVYSLNRSRVYPKRERQIGYAKRGRDIFNALQVKGDLDGAIDAYQHAVRINPEDANDRVYSKKVSHQTVYKAFTNKDDLINY